MDSLIIQLYIRSQCVLHLIGNIQSLAWHCLHKLVLHPWYKSSYFHKAGWPCERITTAEGLLQDEWNANYKQKTMPAEMQPMVVMHLYSVCIYKVYKAHSSLCRLHHLRTNILIISKHSTLCLWVTQSTNGSILLRSQLLLMAYNTGQLWQQADIPWH